MFRRHAALALDVGLEWAAMKGLFAEDRGAGDYSHINLWSAPYFEHWCSVGRLATVGLYRSTESSASTITRIPHQVRRNQTGGAPTHYAVCSGPMKQAAHLEVIVIVTNRTDWNKGETACERQGGEGLRPSNMAVQESLHVHSRATQSGGIQLPREDSARTELGSK